LPVSAEPAVVAEQVEQVAPPAPSAWWRRLLVIAAPVAVVTLVAGLWYSGILPPMLGMAGKPAGAAAHPPIMVDLPEMVANLNSDPRRPRYIKLKAEVQVARRQDVAAVKAAMPQLQDLFQTYLREQRPEDLQGAIGTYRLRQELIARADVAIAPVRIEDILFVEMLVQ
jgi:flagellar protein FliL